MADVSKSMPVSDEPPLSYREMGLVELVRRIVEKSDHSALEELHTNRPVFHFQGGNPVLLIQYLNLMRERIRNIERKEGASLILADRAYDLTLEKFFHIPGEKSNNGIDCRNYYRAFVRKMELKSRSDERGEGLRAEAYAASVLQGLVRKHFALSLKEARRESNSFWSRYQWKIKGKSMSLWLPKVLWGQKRRLWLEKHIPDADPERPGERERVQKIIDQLHARTQFVSLDDLPYSPSLRTPPAPVALGSAPGLAARVAEEKADNIGLQRPSIRALGPQKLHELIVRIFESIEDEEYQQQKIAAEFGLSVATLSRFAGSDWKRNRASKGPTPDLWRNASNVISQIPVFREVAEELGLLDTIEAVRGEPHD